MLVGYGEVREHSTQVLSDLSVVCTPRARGHFGNMIPMLLTRLVRRAGFIS